MRRCLAVLAACTIAATALAGPASAMTVPKPKCSVSAAAFANPFTTDLPDPVASLQTYQHKTWAGSAYDGMQDSKSSPGIPAKP